MIERASLSDPGGPPPRRSAPPPRDAERPFGADEIFFSTTDRRGIIRSGNRVFARVSGYSRAELIGQPHNVIRHPDMPRAAFQLMWEEIQAGRPFAAYVKNLAKDGAHYWVLATVVPCEGGYLSVRIKPATAYFDAARAIYPDLLALERQTEAGDPRRRTAAMAAARVRLGDQLQQAGFASYDQFMQMALLAEAMERERQRASVRGSIASGTPAASSPPDGTLNGLHDDCTILSTFLGLLVARLDAYAGLGGRLREKIDFVVDLADSMRLFSLNALLAATRTSGDHAGLEAVASLMQARSDQSDPVFRALTDDALACTEQLDQMLLPVAVTRLQVEAAQAFVTELLERRDDEAALAGDLVALARTLADGTDHLSGMLLELDQRIRRLAQHVDQLGGALTTMRVLEINGRIEAARSDKAGDVVALFGTIAEQIGAARLHLDELAGISSFSLAREAAEARQARQHVTRIRAGVSTLG